MKKKVDVFCAAPFVIGPACFAGKCVNVILNVDDIRTCLLNKAFVWELTKEGKRIPLDFSNYRLDNGGVVDDDYIPSNDIRMKKSTITNIIVNTKKDGTVEEKRETIVVEKKEKPKVKVFVEKKEEVNEEKKEATTETKVVTEMNVSTKVEEVKEETEAKEEKKFDKFDKNNKHNKK